MKYFEAGEKKIVFFERNSFPRLSIEQQLAVAGHWNKVTSKNPSAFNGGIYCCNGSWGQGKLVIFGVNHSDYATYKWARDEKLAIPGAYTMGTGTYLFDPTKNCFVFVKRTRNVETDPNTISVASGGVLEYKPDRRVRMHGFLDFVCKQARAETLEELSVQDLSQEKFLGLYLDEDTCKLEFAFFATAIVSGIANDENSHLVFVPRGEVESFYGENKGNMEESTRKHLSHWAKRLDKGSFYLIY